jgi:hypothetical protein
MSLLMIRLGKQEECKCLLTVYVYTMYMYVCIHVYYEV